MAKRFEGKVMLITGGGSGIGEATAERAASEGAKVVLVGRTQEKLDEAAKGIRKRISSADIFTIAVNVSIPADNETMVSKSIEKFGRLDAAFLNAGAPTLLVINASFEQIELFGGSCSNFSWRAFSHHQLAGTSSLC
jgi:NAD(P)-dependent dehydrogenase (short-subunit alcohol dehydrogenase family)